MFKKFRGMRLSYYKQGLIYFICMNVQEMPENVKEKIASICLEVGKENYKALYEVLTNSNKSVLRIAEEHFMSEKKLYRMRKEFYERFNEITVNIPSKTKNVR